MRHEATIGFSRQRSHERSAAFNDQAVDGAAESDATNETKLPRI